MVEFAEPGTFEESDVDHVPDAYREFRDGEGVPVHNGLYVEDVARLETGYWDRTGQAGAFINLYGAEGVDDLQLHEIEPRGETTAQRHVYEAIVYAVEGRGLVAVGPEDDETVFEWERHSMFFVPPNTPYRYVNLDDNAPALLLAQTPLPQFFNLVANHRFPFESDYDGWETTDVDYGADGTMHEGEVWPVVWEANFIPDLRTFDKLEALDFRGAGGTSLRIRMPHSSMFAHVSEFPVGTYKKAHRHGPGASVYVLSGEGYSLLWREGWDRLAKVRWGPRSVFTPPARWFHQHFNTGSEPARYFAIHTPKLGNLYDTDMFSPFLGDNQIEYVDEDSAIRAEYEDELETAGIDNRMPTACYGDPDFEF